MAPAKPITAKKNHGKCVYCPKDIEPGEQYERFIRSATAKERDDPNIKTFSLPGRGPHVEQKAHAECARIVRESRFETYKLKRETRRARSEPGTASLGELLL